MKHFYLMLTCYSLGLIAACSLIFYFFIIRPSVGQLASRLNQTTADLTSLKDAVAQIKLTVDRLEVRTTTFNDRVKGIQSVLDTPSGTESAQIADRLSAVNQQIDQKLTQLNHAPGTGGLTNDSALTKVTLEPTSPADPALGYIKIKSSAWPTIDVYPSPNVSSQPVGQLQNSAVYPFLQKQSGWYQVRLNSATAGWVPATYLTETSDL
jgi:hypothetical protein